MQFAFAAPTPAAVPIAGDARAFPVHRIYCVGRNYADHAREMGFSEREAPFFFMKPADAVVPVPTGEVGSIAYPGQTSNLHHEIELVAAIGKGGSDIAAADALSHVWGWAVGLDMTRRDLQFALRDKGRPWDIAKGYDESAPIGPIHPRAAVGDMSDAAIKLAVNGQVRQNSNVDQLIWSVAETIEHLSRFYRLAPGDLIYTGTPAGVGAVTRGDLLEGEVERLGTLAIRIA